MLWRAATIAIEIIKVKLLLLWYNLFRWFLDQSTRNVDRIMLILLRSQLCGRGANSRGLNALGGPVKAKVILQASQLAKVFVAYLQLGIGTVSFLLTRSSTPARDAFGILKAPTILEAHDQRCVPHFQSAHAAAKDAQTFRRTIPIRDTFFILKCFAAQR